MGDYTYTLTNPTEEGVDDVETFTYTVNSDGFSSSSTLTVNVVDDAPQGTQTLGYVTPTQSLSYPS